VPLPRAEVEALTALARRLGVDPTPLAGLPA
jgi:hypothetical protein